MCEILECYLSRLFADYTNLLCTFEGLFYFLIQAFKFLTGWLAFKSAKEGAQTTIHLAVSEDVKGVTGM